MYEFIKSFHSHFKYIVLLSFIMLIIWTLIGLLNKKKYSKTDKILLTINVAIVDLQVVMGLLLYFIYSPKGLGAFTEFGSAVMKNSELRYFAVEHVFSMLIGLILVHYTSIRVKKMIKNHLHSTSIFRFQLIILLATFVVIMLRFPF